MKSHEKSYLKLIYDISRIFSFFILQLYSISIKLIHYALLFHSSFNPSIITLIFDFGINFLLSQEQLITQSDKTGS